MDILNGTKTYIVAVLLVLVGIVRSRHLIDDASFQAALSVLTGAGIAALRHGVTVDRDAIEPADVPHQGT